MTVRDLIARLSELPQDARVVVNLGKNERANGAECGAARLTPAVQHHAYWQEPVFVAEAEDLVVNVTNS